MAEHIHDCTGPDQRCPCGYEFRVPPICLSIEVTNGRTVLVSEGFNCDSIGPVVDALREAADKLEGL